MAIAMTVHIPSRKQVCAYLKARPKAICHRLLAKGISFMGGIQPYLAATWYRPAL